MQRKQKTKKPTKQTKKATKQKITTKNPGRWQPTVYFFLKSTSTPVFFIYCGMNDNIKPKHENIQLILHYVL